MECSNCNVPVVFGAFVAVVPTCVKHVTAIKFRIKISFLLNIHFTSITLAAKLYLLERAYVIVCTIVMTSKAFHTQQQHYS